MGKYLFQNLTTRLVSTFLLLAIPGALLVGFSSYHLARRALEKSVYEKLEAAATLQEAELRRWILSKKKEIIRMVDAPFLRRYARAVRVPGDMDPEEIAGAYTSLSRLLEWFLEGSEDFREVFLLTWQEGRVFLSTDKTHQGDYRINDSYFVKGKEGTYVQKVKPSPVTVQPSIYISVPLLSEYGEKLGVLAGLVDLDRMDEILRDVTNLEGTGEAYLVDRFNNLVSARRFARGPFNRGVHSEGIEAAVAGESGRGLYRDYRGIPVIGVYRWLGDLDLVLMIEVQQQEAFAPARHLGWSLFFVGMGIAATLSVAMFLLAGRITRPILMVRDAAARLAEGDFSAKAPVVTGDEVGMLAASFNEMTDQLESLYQALLTSEEHFRTIFRLSPDAIAVVRLKDEVFVDVNEGFAEVTGFSKEEVVGRSTDDVGPWLENPGRDEFLHQLALGRHLYRREITFVRKGGASFIGSISARVVEIGGEPHRVSVIRDVTDLRVAEKQLLRTHAILTTQMEASVSGILVVDEKGEMISFNRRFVEIFQLSPEVVASRSDERAIQSILNQIVDPEAFLRRIEHLYAHQEEHSRDEFHLKDGRIIERYSAPMTDADGLYYGRVWYFNDVTGLRQSEEELRASVREKDVLLQEIHHRVKNNLQVISGLLDLQRHHITDPKSREVYKESRNRVLTMALIHEELYAARNLVQVDYGTYIRNLVNNLFKSYAIEPDRIDPDIQVEDIRLVVDTAIPCALIINELVSNALKHAFPGDRRGRVRIVFRQEDGRYHLEVADTGVGLPPGLDILKSPSLGMKLVHVLVEQLSGTMEIRPEGGTAFIIEFEEYREAGTRMD